MWDQMDEGDLVFFYVTKPVSGVVGYGIIEETIVEDYALWPNEIRQNRVSYP